MRCSNARARGCAQNINAFFIDLIIDTYFARCTGLVSKDTVSMWFSLLMFLVCSSQVPRVCNKNRAHVAHEKHPFLIVSRAFFNNTLAETTKVIESTLLSSPWTETGRKVSCSAEDSAFLKINIYFIWLWYGLHGNCRRNRSQCLIHWRWCGFGEGELLNNYCLCFLLRTQGGGAPEKEDKKSVLTPETLTWTDQYGDKDWYFSSILSTYLCMYS